MTTQPLLILGGAPGPDPEASFASWERALAMPSVRGLVVGRSLLYPADGDVEGAVAPRRRHRADGGVEAGRDALTAATHPWHLGPVHSVTPEQVGWTYCGLRIVSLAAGAELELATGSEEFAVVPARRGGEHGRRRGAALRPRRAVVGVRPGHRLVLPADRRRGAPGQPRRCGAGAGLGPGAAALRPRLRARPATCASSCAVPVRRPAR